MKYIPCIIPVIVIGGSLIFSAWVNHMNDRKKKGK